MFSLAKQVFIVLLSFCSSLARDQTKYLLLNNELCMVRPTLIYFNPIELEYYLFMISLDKCRSCNVLSTKSCVPEKTKDINAQAFSMITNKKEVKAMKKHISSDYKCKFNSTVKGLDLFEG